MPRALWKGSISFGLVNIPIELHTAVRDHRPRFRMLHAADKSPVKYERVCIRDGHAVAWEDLVKGYEVAQRLKIAVARAAAKCPALRSVRLSPHTIRHTTAMHLLLRTAIVSTPLTGSHRTGARGTPASPRPGTRPSRCPSTRPSPAGRSPASGDGPTRR